MPERSTNRAAFAIRQSNDYVCLRCASSRILAQLTVLRGFGASPTCQMPCCLSADKIICNTIGFSESVGIKVTSIAAPAPRAPGGLGVSVCDFNMTLPDPLIIASDFVARLIESLPITNPTDANRMASVATSNTTVALHL